MQFAEPTLGCKESETPGLCEHVDTPIIPGGSYVIG